MKISCVTKRPANRPVSAASAARGAGAIRRAQVLLAALFLAAAPASAGVDLVQIDADNAALYLDRQARKTVRAGDVLISNGIVQAAILTTSTPSDPTRAGRCVLLHGPVSALQTTSIAVEPIQGVGWEAPQAGMKNGLAVVRFHRESQNARAELTYRLSAFSASLEISTRIINNDSQRTLEIPVVDGVFAAPAKASAQEGGTVLAEDAGLAAAYFAAGATAEALEGRSQWNLGWISGDPLPGAFRRVSTRILTLGRGGEQYFNPVQPDSGWNRRLRDRETWFRLPPGTQRTLERHLVVAAAKEEALQLAGVIQSGRRVEIQPSASVPSSPGGGRTPTPARTVSNSNNSSTRIVGKLRGQTPPPAPLPSAVLEPSIAPALPSQPSQDDSPDFAPTIEAIENLPPPTE